ncbi:adenine phosphoribosyltransferase [Nonlabens marinus]|uniref:Adenine phosphoribosyltransferase n=1 Tax=Nonlabens marinus S1-08 TaxID=1454201 RepID=W8VTW6_9FLAO|nr:adenine phosphoribosyltransferase [Nonlabens marinus]BAO54063.1 adenine phosphoribosyltransferase [Nonlabens marinus S1-08]
MDIENLKSHVHDIPDFPKEGIVFKDIAPLLASAKARNAATKLLAKPFMNQQVDYVVGMEARGFLFGSLLADVLDAGFVMVRKPNKLPGSLVTQEYQLEYGTDAIEMQLSAIPDGATVLIHDDVLATGGTAAATARLIKKAGGSIIGASFLIELDFLNGRAALDGIDTYAVLHY